jgi:serine/threonine protein kinase
MYEVIATESHIWLVTELCTGGELFDYLVERGRLLEGEARRIFGELVVAVGTLHRKGTVHRDLKLENVFLDGDCQVKLGDLGFAREWSRGQKLLDTFCGTTGYASPEMLQGKKYSGEGGFRGLHSPTLLTPACRGRHLVFGNHSLYFALWRSSL